MKNYIITANSRFHRVFTDRTTTVRETIDYFAEKGFGGIDVNLEYIFDYGDDWRRHAEKHAEYAAKKGLDLSFGHLPFHASLFRGADGKNDKKAFGRFVFETLEAAKVLGLKRAVIHPKHLEDREDDFDANLKANIEKIAPIAEKAEKLGIRLLVENMPNYYTDGRMRFGCLPEHIIPVADYFGCGICWDTGHANISGVDQRAGINAVGKRLGGLHLNDNVAGHIDAHLIPFFGTSDWEGVMKGLGDIGYDGTFNFECRTYHMPESASGYVGEHLLCVAHTLLSMLDGEEEK